MQDHTSSQILFGLVGRVGRLIDWLVVREGGGGGA